MATRWSGGKYASGRRDSNYTSCSWKLRVNILESDKRPDQSEMIKEDSGVECGWKGMQGSCSILFTMLGGLDFILNTLRSYLIGFKQGATSSVYVFNKLFGWNA